MTERVAELHVELCRRQPVDVQVKVPLAVQLLAIRLLLVACKYLRGAASVHDRHHQIARLEGAVDDPWVPAQTIDRRGLAVRKMAHHPELV